ncbi:hypothetical protein M885DRAFT_565744 [Pelagophyceae sp. CCMP2097]|nr:hypothetical protein M885DRAFT_565744 [Pelagophyceae sp. CCMP2097]
MPCCKTVDVVDPAHTQPLLAPPRQPPPKPPSEHSPEAETGESDVEAQDSDVEAQDSDEAKEDAPAKRKKRKGKKVVKRKKHDEALPQKDYNTTTPTTPTGGSALDDCLGGEHNLKRFFVAAVDIAAAVFLGFLCLKKHWTCTSWFLVTLWLYVGLYALSGAALLASFAARSGDFVGACLVDAWYALTMVLIAASLLLVFDALPVNDVHADCGPVLYDVAHWLVVASPCWGGIQLTYYTFLVFAR